VVLLSEAGVIPLQGRLNSSLAPFLDGKMMVSEIIAQVEGTLDPLDVVYGIDELRRLGYVVDAGDDDEFPGPLGTLAETLQVPAKTLRKRVTSTPVTVRSTVPGAAELLEGLLHGQGLRVDTNGGFTVVLTADYLDPELERVNREAAGPWMPVRPVGSVAWIGPVFEPGRGACWLCLATRLRAVRAGWGVPVAGELPLSAVALSPAALTLAALEAAKWVLRPRSASHLTTFDLKSMRMERHAVPRLSDCPACGSPRTPKAAAPIVLRKRRTAFSLDGGHRAAAPEETFARYEHLISPLAGVVHSVERVPVAEGSIVSVHAARHNFGLSPRQSLGKGMTAAQSRTGALCEALERYSGIFRGDEPLVRASFRDLGGEAVHPNACALYSRRQKKPFNERRKTDWAAAWSLSDKRHRYVAAAYCYYGYEDPFCQADSNGNAAGSSLEDAILQGLLELVERDAVALWWYSRARRPAAALETAYFEAIAREYAAAGRRISLLDLTTDLEIPAVAALSQGRDADDCIFGFGAHPDPAIAATRAVTEMNQPFALSRGQRRAPWTSPLSDRSFLEPDPSLPVRTRNGRSFSGGDLRADVMACVNVLRRNGLETLVLDQTREEIGLPVVKVIVPGLRHFRPRFGPGRLYDVPPRLGWIERPLEESELNSSHLAV
jgi:bacteriocin biosynthesis cyclodehydratase domain-containing protein